MLTGMITPTPHFLHLDLETQQSFDLLWGSVIDETRAAGVSLYPPL